MTTTLNQNKNDKKVITSYQPIMRNIAKSYNLKFSNMPVDDLMQIAAIGLLKAYRKYNGQDNLKSYAVKYMHGEIKHFLRDKYSMFKVSRELQKMEDNNMYNVNSLDVPCNDENNGTLMDNLQDNNKQDLDIKLTIDNAVKMLKGDLKKVIFLKYYYDLKQSEIARRMQISEMQVSRLHEKAINMLKDLVK